MSADQPCSCRRKTTTALCCARCNKPICPDCLVLTAAGQFCRDCSKGGGLALLQPDAKNLALAAVASTAASLVGGWLIMGLFGGFGFFRLWGSFLYGLLIAETALRASGRKRGIKMEILVGICSGMGIMVMGVLRITSLGDLGIVDAMLIILQKPWDMIILSVAVLSAVARIRNL